VHQLIESEVRQYFRQHDLLAYPQVGKCYLALHPDLRFRCEIDSHTGEQQVELFTTDNLYFTTYPISQQLYLRLQEIFSIQPQCIDYINSVNRDLIYGLVCKGILLLKFTQTNIDNHPAMSLNSSVISINAGSSRSTELAGHDELSIAELQTKTTPTSLSSYLS
jgi:carbamoyltransferase